MSDEIIMSGSLKDLEPYVNSLLERNYELQKSVADLKRLAKAVDDLGVGAVYCRDVQVKGRVMSWFEARDKLTR